MKKLPIALIAGSTVFSTACEAREDADAIPETADPAIESAPEEAGEEAGEEAAEARQLATDAAETAEQMNEDTELRQLIGQARGIFIVPNYGRGAAIVGGRAGEGVLMTRQNGGWTGPGLYELGGVSVGAELGAKGGEIAILLMNDKAVESFRSEDTFSLNASAGLTITDYSAGETRTTRPGDVIMWSDMEGAFAGVSLGVTDIHWDDEENRAYYGQSVTPSEVMDGDVQDEHGDALRQALRGSN